MRWYWLVPSLLLLFCAVQIAFLDESRMGLQTLAASVVINAANMVYSYAMFWRPHGNR